MRPQFRFIHFVFASVALAHLIGCRAKPPGKAESATMSWIKHHVTIGGKKIKNPLAATAANIDAGKHVFGYYCVECHGRDGQNTGVPFAANLAPPIPSLASPQVQSYTDGQLKRVIDNGIFPSGMPASKGVLNDDEIWQTVLYIRHLPPAGSLGEPRAYTGDEYDTPDAPSQ
jgi:mono/diheme cytochrome c family protein